MRDVEQATFHPALLLRRMSKGEMAVVKHVKLDTWQAGPDRHGGADVVETEATQDIQQDVLYVLHICADLVTRRK